MLLIKPQLINSDRRGQAQNVANSVRARHDAIQKIEQDMIQLAQLYQDLEAQVIQQEPAVTQIEQRGEEVNDHVAKANTELDGAVVKARAARRKKWWCLGIVGTRFPPPDTVELRLTRHSPHSHHHRCRCGRGRHRYQVGLVPPLHSPVTGMPSASYLATYSSLRRLQSTCHLPGCWPLV